MPAFTAFNGFIRLADSQSQQPKEAILQRGEAHTVYR